MTGPRTRATILDAAHQAVMVDRAATHGDAENNLAAIAGHWSWWLASKLRPGTVVTTGDVAQMMVGLKQARARSNPRHLDNYVDQCGYSTLAGEVAALAQPSPAADEASAPTDPIETRKADGGEGTPTGSSRKGAGDAALCAAPTGENTATSAAGGKEGPVCQSHRGARDAAATSAPALQAGVTRRPGQSAPHMNTWRAEEDEMLLDGAAVMPGVSISQVARQLALHLPGRSVRAIDQRLRRLLSPQAKADRAAEVRAAAAIHAPEPEPEPAAEPAPAPEPAPEPAPAPVFRHQPIRQPAGPVTPGIRLGRALDALPVGDWLPGDDDDLAQSLARGLGVAAIAAQTGRSTDEVTARWKQLARAATGSADSLLTIEQEVLLRQTLRQRADRQATSTEPGEARDGS